MRSGDDPVRIGVVGCGRLTEHGYLHAIARVAGARLVGVADPDPIRRERAAGLAATLGDAVPAYTGIAALLRGTGPEAVVLASPAGAHLAGAEVATEAGVAVLVEKPPAPDAAGAAALAALTPAPWIAFNRRFDAGVRALRSRLPTDRPLDLHLSIEYRRRSWRPHVVDDDVLDDLGPHLVDWARWLTGREVVEVTTPETVAEPIRRRPHLGACGRARISAASDRLHHERIECRELSGRRVACWSRGGPARAVLGRLRRGDHPAGSEPRRPAATRS